MINLLTAYKDIEQSYKINNILEKSEVDWLFCNILKLDRAKLFITDEITNGQFRRIKKISQKRIKGIPLAKIIKLSNFYGFDFKVNNDVLTPRQETELLCEKVIEDFKDSEQKNILDLCTGSGAIAIILKKYLKNNNIIASDISCKALRVAKYNAKKHSVQISFVKSNLFDKIEGSFDAIVSNPPYIKTCEIEGLQTEVKDYDPFISLDGGITGFNFYKQIIKLAPQKLNTNGKLYLELGLGQYEQVVKMLSKNFTDINIIKDYNNIERVIYATKK